MGIQYIFVKIDEIKGIINVPVNDTSVCISLCVCVYTCVCACDSGFLYWCFGYAFYGPKLVHFIRRLLRFLVVYELHNETTG